MFKNITYMLARLVAAILMGQTLFFKFSGSPESMYIFSKIGMEPEGRWMVGFMELIAAILLVVPQTAWLGGLFSIGLMAGAVGLHLTILGIEVMNDGGLLFGFAIAVFLCSIYVTFINKEKIIKEVLPKIFGKK